MTEKRFTIQGYRDYRGVQLQDIVEDLGELKDELESSIDKFKSYRKKAEEYCERLDNPDDLIAVLDYFVSLFSGHLEDLKRLVQGIPLGVQDKHIETVNQIYESCKHEGEYNYSAFKSNFLSSRLKDNYIRYRLIDPICSLYGDTLFKLLILADISNRLKTFVGDGTLSRPKSAKDLRKPDTSRINIPEDTKWDDIKLGFLGPEDLQIHIKFKPYAAKSYVELGFLDKRTSKGKDQIGKPNRLWLTLASFARCKGEINWKSGGAFPQKAFIKNVSDLRKHLKAIFGIRSTPISEYRKQKIKTYRAIFQIAEIDSDLVERIIALSKSPKVYNTDHTIED